MTTPTPTTEIRPPSERTLVVPELSAPDIDGVMSEGEWAGATVVTMSNDDKLHWMRSGGALYMVLEGDDLGAVNLVIASERQMWVLHSSAALGSQLFESRTEGWKQVHGYSWCCRSTVDDSQRIRLLEEEGWQANIGFTGDVGVVEFQVEMPWTHASVAVALHTELNDPAFWPSGLSVDAREKLVGNAWTDPTFTIDEWWTIVPIE